MDGITPEQFVENAKSWEPGEDFEAQVLKQLRRAHAPEELVPSLGRAFDRCSRSTFDYIQYIHGLATTQEIDKNNLIPQVAKLVGLVQMLKDSAKDYEAAFKGYDSLTREGLTRDRFDTVYYDAIQNLDLRTILKRIIDEVEMILQSFSLVSSDLTGIQCTDLYESSIRFQLFLQYFMATEKFNAEELWSILFDVYNQVSEMEGSSIGPTEDELKDLHEKIQKFKTN